MPDHEQFLRGIEADPESDAPRLVCADGLDEHGDADRATFIRLQCEAHHIEFGPWPRKGPIQLSAKDQKRVKALEAEADALLARHRDEWTNGMPKWVRKDVGFQRGFLNFYYITGKQLVDDGAAIRKVAPLGGYLSLRLTKGREAAVFDCKHLSMVTRWWLDGCELTDAHVKLLAASPYLGRVAELDLSRGGLGSLDKAVNRLGDAAAVAVADAKNLPSLTALHLRGPYRNLTAAGVRAVVESPRRKGLTTLDVCGGPGGPGFADLFRSPKFRLTGLKELYVGDRRLGDAGAITLAGCPKLAGLTSLWLDENDVGDEGALAVLQSPHLRGLREIRFWRNPRITDATARALLADRRKWEKVALDETSVSASLQAEVKARCDGK